MKIQQFYLVAVAVFVLDCGGIFTPTSTLGIEVPASKLQLTLEQKNYLEKYCTYRQRFLKLLKLPLNSTPEEVKVKAAPKFLRLPATSSWGDILAQKRVQKYLTEERRQRFSTIFCSNTRATWLELLSKVEELRKMRVEK